MGDGGEGRHRPVAPGVAQRADQRAMPAHGMPGDAAAVGHREVRLDQRRQFLHHVVVHAVVPGPGLLGRVEVEAGAKAEIPGAFRIVRHALAARAGVRRDDDQAQLRRGAERTGLLHEVLVRAGQAREPVEHRQPGALLGLRRQVDGEHHVAVERGRAVAIALVPAAEAFLAGDIFEGHKSSWPQAASRRLQAKARFACSLKPAA